MPPYPVTKAFVDGMLDVGDGHRIYWEAAGNPNGKPAVILHGGPGSGMSDRTRRMFDPDRYLIVQFDQRQCGQSTPHAADPVVDLSTNTTPHLIADIELLREHLGVDRWLVWGGSWGTTLGLAYAEAHPDRVSEMILASVVMTTHADVDWVTRAMGRVFPEQWERFRDVVARRNVTEIWPPHTHGCCKTLILRSTNLRRRRGAIGKTRTSPRTPATSPVRATRIRAFVWALPGWLPTTGATRRSWTTTNCSATPTASPTSRC